MKGMRWIRRRSRLPKEDEDVMVIVDGRVYPQATLMYGLPLDVRHRVMAGTATREDFAKPKIPLRWLIEGFERGSSTTFDVDCVSHWLKLEMPTDLRRGNHG